MTSKPMPQGLTRVTLPLLFAKSYTVAKWTSYSSSKYEDTRQRASANFLGANLAMKVIRSTEGAIEQALKRIRTGMAPGYECIETSIARGLRKSDRDLVNCVPAWVACSQRVITLAEFSQALESDLFGSYYWRGMGAFRFPPRPFTRGYDPPEYPQVPSQYLCARTLDQRYYGPSTAVGRVTGCHLWSGSEAELKRIGTIPAPTIFYKWGNSLILSSLLGSAILKCYNLTLHAARRGLQQALRSQLGLYH